MFEVPASKATEKDYYEFAIPGDTDEKGKQRVHKVPLMRFLPGDVVDVLAQGEMMGGMPERASRYALFGLPGTPSGDAVRRLDSDQLEALIDDYAAASKLAVGESAASTDS